MVYAAYNKDEIIRNGSSSGGIYYLLASKVLEDNGIVFASAYEGIKVKYIPIECKEDLIKTQGAKYAPSEIGNTFRQVKKELDSNRYVLFVGLPCQCAGLQSYLQKEYENLIITSVVCHGVPSPLALDKYCKDKKIKSVNMRDKTNGWSQYNWRCLINEHEQIINHNKVSFMKGFISDLYLRPCCYECHFKFGIGDLTIGDFWGIQNVLPSMHDDKGTSIILVNTDKGKTLFNNISDSIVFEKVDGNEYIKYNGGFSIASKNKKREEFFLRLQSKEDFDTIIGKLVRIPFIKRIKGKIKTIVKRIQVF